MKQSASQPNTPPAGCSEADMPVSAVTRGRDRIAFVDMAKCIALVCLIVGHTEGSFMMVSVDSMMLPVFWICSGYTTVRDISIRRKARLLLYYALMTAVCMLFAVFYAGLEFDVRDIWGALYARFSIYDAPLSASNPGLLPLYNAVLWFVPSLFTTYVVFALIIKARTFRWQALLCAASLCAATLLDGLPVLLPWSIDSAFLFAVFMCIGRWLRRYRVLERGGASVAVCCAVAFICLSAYTGFTNLSVRQYGGYWPSIVVTATAGTVALLMICRYTQGGWLGRLAVWLDSEALFIFGLQLVFIRLVAEWCSGTVESWKLRVMLLVLGCFAGGMITGKLCRLLVGGFARMLRIRMRNGT